MPSFCRIVGMGYASGWHGHWDGVCRFFSLRVRVECQGPGGIHFSKCIRIGAGGSATITTSVPLQFSREIHLLGVRVVKKINLTQVHSTLKQPIKHLTPV